MSASAHMPYFIKPSQPLSAQEKVLAYQQILSEFKILCTAEDSTTVKMVTINSLIKTHLPYAYWVGFYIWTGTLLEVGPYQGTLGCIYIEQGRGVCGKAAATKKTQLVADCHALAQGTDHIACDPNSQSEIVVPVLDEHGGLLGVLDLDSSLKESFDHIDQRYLEELVTFIG